LHKNITTNGLSMRWRCTKCRWIRPPPLLLAAFADILERS